MKRKVRRVWPSLAAWSAEVDRNIRSSYSTRAGSRVSDGVTVYRVGYHGELLHELKWLARQRRRRHTDRAITKKGPR